MNQKAPQTNTQRSSVPLFQVAGIRITLDYSWFVIFLLVFFSLSAGYFPRLYPGFSVWTYWGSGLIAALFLFLSIILHELCHSLMAIRSGIKIPEITLFIFGGMARLSGEAKDPKVEFKIAIVGPLCSFALAGLFWGIWTVMQDGQLPIVAAIFRYLAGINLALGIFNLVPGFPLDGGRLLRSIWWWKTGSLTEATRVASNLGKGFAYALMALGAIQIFTGSLIGGMWLLLIGMFLKGAAQQGYFDLLAKQSLETVPVQDVMMNDVIGVSPNLPLDQLIRQYFFRYCFSGFPVMQGDRVLGVVSIDDVKKYSEEEQRTKTVSDVMVPMNDQIRVKPDDSLAFALEKMLHENVGRLLVMQDGHLSGIVSKLGVYRFLELKNVAAPAH